MKVRSRVALALAAVFSLAGCPSGSSSTTPSPLPAASTPTSSSSSSPSPTSSPAASSSSPSPAASATPVASPSATTGASPKPAGATGTIHGVVKITRAVPENEVADVAPAEQAPCGGAKHTKPETLVKDGGLANVIVQIKSKDVPRDAIPKGWAPTTPLVVDQKGCEYSPRVAVAAVGQTVTFKNSDATLHNVNIKSGANGNDNKAIGGGGSEDCVFKKPDRVALACNVHPFMGGTILVTNHPWATVSAADGSFTIANVPAGTYRLVAYHEKLGDADREGFEVKVEAGKTADVTITYK